MKRHAIHWPGCVDCDNGDGDDDGRDASCVDMMMMVVAKARRGENSGEEEGETKMKRTHGSPGGKTHCLMNHGDVCASLCVYVSPRVCATLH